MLANIEAQQSVQHEDPLAELLVVAAVAPRLDIELHAVDMDKSERGRIWNGKYNVHYRILRKAYSIAFGCVLVFFSLNADWLTS